MTEQLVKFQEEMRGKYQSYREILSFFKDKQKSAEFEQLYRTITGKRLTGCSNCRADAFIELMSMKPTQIEAIMSRKFKLRNGVLLYDFNDSSNNATNKNLTDELALHHLRQDPKKIKFFETYPENWEEMIEQKEEGTETQEVEESKEGTETQEEKIEESEESAGAEADKIAKAMASGINNAKKK